MRNNANADVRIAIVASVRQLSCCRNTSISFIVVPTEGKSSQVEHICMLVNSLDVRWWVHVPVFARANRS